MDLNSQADVEALRRIIKAELAEHKCNGAACNTPPTTMCSTEQRLSSRLYQQALKRATDTAKYQLPLGPGISADIVIPPYPIGWKMGPFTASVTMAPGGDPNDITQQVIIDGDVLHEWSGDEYREMQCCEILRRLVVECIGWQTAVTFRLIHTGGPGDPPLASWKANFARLYNVTPDGRPNPIWGVDPVFGVCTRDQWNRFATQAVLQGPNYQPQGGVVALGQAVATALAQAALNPG